VNGPACLTSYVAFIQLEEAGTHKSAKTHAGKTQRPAASGREGVTRKKHQVSLALLVRRDITAGKPIVT